MNPIPDTYTVKSGDTLSDIALKFFKNPKRWYDIWVKNMKEIPDPDLIYPGQVLILVEKKDTASQVLQTSRLRECVQLQHNEIGELVMMLRELRDEYKQLPHSLGYEFTHMPKVDAKLLEYGIQIPS